MKTLKTAVSIEAHVRKTYEIWSNEVESSIESTQKQIDQLRNGQHPKGQDASAEYDSAAVDCKEYYAALVIQRENTKERVKGMVEKSFVDADEVIKSARSQATLLNLQAEYDDDETQRTAKELGIANMESAKALATSLRTLANRRAMTINDEMDRLVLEAEQMIDQFTNEKAENAWNTMSEKRLLTLKKLLETFKDQKRELDKQKANAIRDATKRVSNWSQEVERLDELAAQATLAAAGKLQSLKKNKEPKSIRKR